MESQLAVASSPHDRTDMTAPTDQTANRHKASHRKLVTKMLVLAGILVAGVVGYTQFGDVLTLENLASKESDLQAYRSDHPWLVYGLAWVVYVAVTGLSLPGAAVLTLVYGWYFDLVPGVILVSFASTAGATTAFLTSRYLFRDSIQNRFGSRLESFNENLQREGAFYLFTLRLIPAVPFFVINVVMGLTPMKTRTFWWVSQLGMFFGTIAFVYAGSSVPDLQTLADQGAGSVLSPRLILAFVLLGLFPLVAKQIVKRFKRSDPSAKIS